MDLLGTAIVALFYATLGVASIYGCHRTYLLALFARRRAPAPARPAPPDPLPRVTVQLPIYNEIYVAERLIRAACALDYPADRLQIQVLDDSTDGTTRIAHAAVAAARRPGGPEIVHLRRETRAGYKAGALDRGLGSASGELIAIFDADFVPPVRFLRDLVHHFGRPEVGMVQARWGHINREYSVLTRLQSIFLDGHFAIEQTARHGAGLFFNFNGTAGIWRRACIESAGGWQHDTLTEDLDLSYRAQLAGWKFVFVADVEAPAEVPADIDAFRSQQHRWACGSIQTARKLLPRILGSALPPRVKIEALFHLTNYGAHALMLLLAVLVVPATLLRARRATPVPLLVDLALFFLSTISVSAFYLAGQRAVGRGLRRTAPLIPLALTLGFGLCLNNARAFRAAFRGGAREFTRTPKHRLEGRGGDWRAAIYRAPRHGGLVAAEMAFAIYFTAATAYALAAGLYASLPFFLLFQAGFLHISLLSLAAWARPPAGATTLSEAGSESA